MQKILSHSANFFSNLLTRSDQTVLGSLTPKYCRQLLICGTSTYGRRHLDTALALARSLWQGQGSPRRRSSCTLVRTGSPPAPSVVVLAQTSRNLSRRHLHADHTGRHNRRRYCSCLRHHHGRIHQHLQPTCFPTIGGVHYITLKLFRLA